MRIDNSAFGSRDFVEKLVSQKEASTDELAKILGNRIEELKKNGETLKYLDYALKQKLWDQNRLFTGGLFNISKTHHDMLTAVVDNIR